MAKEKGDFSKGSVPGAIMRLAVPLFFAQIVAVLYNIVDRIYIGHIDTVGRLALTGVGVTFPVITIITGFTNLCGMGGAPLFSMSRGRGDDEKAGEIMGNSATLLLLFGALIAAAVLIFERDILYAFGASDDTYYYAQSYITIYISGIFFSMLGTGLNSFINNQGYSATGMFTTILGAVTNIALDPFFIFDRFSFLGINMNGFNMGVAGAALATVISQFISAAWVMAFLIFRAPVRLRLRSMALRFAHVKKILSLGVTPLIMSFTTGTVQILYNSSLQRYGGDIYVGTMTVINSIREMIFMGTHGLTSGAQPVISFNYGAGNAERTLKAIRFQTYAGVAYTIAASAIVVLWPEFLIKLFNDSDELLAVAPAMMRIYFSAYFMISFHSVGQFTFLSLGMSGKGMFFSILRKIVVVVPLILLLPLMFPFAPAQSIFGAEPVSDAVAGIACFTTMYVTVWRKLRKGIIPQNASKSPRPL